MKFPGEITLIPLQTIRSVQLIIHHHLLRFPSVITESRSETGNVLDLTMRTKIQESVVSYFIKSNSQERLHHKQQNQDGKRGSRAEQRRLVALFVAFLSTPVGLADITSVFHSLLQNRRDRRSSRRSLLTSHDSCWLVRLRGERVVRGSRFSDIR